MTARGLINRTAVAVVGWVLLIACIRAPGSAAAQETLPCGTPLQRHLANGATDEYAISVADGSIVDIDVADASGTIGLIKLDGGGQETCNGSIQLTGPVDATIEVSACRSLSSGNYTITANVVTQGADNCAAPMPCGQVPYIEHLNLAGETDVYGFYGTEGDLITLSVGDTNGAPGSMRVRLFDPNGSLVTGGDSCIGLTNFALPATGTYTALVSACGVPHTALYGLSFESPRCPTGPDITFFGVARSNGVAQTPDTYDQHGRPVYMTGASGISVVIEARPGPSRFPVAGSAYDYNPNDPTVLPDLQVLLSRPLGNGSPEVCDKTLPNQGGVPATPSLDYNDGQTVANAINDFGCRVDDGTGSPQGRMADNACTQDPQSEDFFFVNSTTTLQFCTPIARNWAFPPGSTVVEARVQDTQGNLGAAREMVVQVGPSCAGDCNGDFTVTVDELLTAVNIALGKAPAINCAAADLNQDGIVTVDEIVSAVNSALNGCS